MPNGNKPLYQPWNEDSFVADEVVQAMNNIQRWIYRTLLQKAFTCSTRPHLPNDNNQLWMLAGCENKAQWMENKSLILKKFEVAGELLTHKRVFADYENWVQLIDKKRFAGQMSAAARAEQVSTYVQQGSKEVSNISKKVSKAQFSETKIAEIWGELTGQVTEPKEQYKKELKELVRVYGEEQILSQFEIWANLNASAGFKRPISAFIKQYQGTASATRNLFKPSEINDLAVELSLCSGGDVTFNRLNLQGLAQLLAEFSQEEIISAFKKFYLEYTGNWQWAAKDFIEKASQLTLVARKLKAEAIRKTDKLKEIDEKMEAEGARRIAILEAETARQEVLASDAMQIFNPEE